MKKIKTVEEKYTELSEIDHILQRPSMWVGPTKEEEKEMFLYDVDDAKMNISTVTYIPAMVKVIDEVISNSCDEFRRKDNMGLTELNVTINDDDSITVKDNGGIPIVVHKDAKVYVPEFIFGRLRTSSNYDDSEDRNVIGVNGVGSALCNVFSTYFEIESCDRKKRYHRSWSNNMKTLNDDLVVESYFDHYTQTKFKLDFKRFGCKGIPIWLIDIIRKRCIDAAAANLGLKVIFKDKDNEPEIWKFKSFDEYIELYSNFVDVKDAIEIKEGQKKIYIYPDGNINVGFVNGAECSKGTHIKGIHAIVNDAVSSYIKKKEKLDVLPKHVDNKYSVFCDIDVSNPTYSSQTKEELSTPLDKFTKDGKYSLSFPDSVINKILKSEIVEIVLDWYKQKVDADTQKEIRKLNKQAKKLFRSDKFIDCNSKKKEERQLWLFEGDSAKSGFRINRDPQTQAGYIMRGVPKNSDGLTPVQVMKNEVFADIVNILGLQWGEYNDVSKLAYSKIVICSDMDYDGSKIAALLLVFFNHFPELFEQNVICRSISPIIVARKGSDERKFFSLEEYKKEESKLKSYKVLYNKGLGGLDNTLYREMMREPIFHYFTKDTLADSMLRKWFAKGIADERKDMLKETVEA